MRALEPGSAVAACHADIADGAIIGSKIADGAVTTGKLAANAAVVVSTTAPASPVIGLLWVDTDG